MPGPLAYPETPHHRRHGPDGYIDDRSWKPWLRDEFAFRCVFCLVRERWSPLGADSFGLEHLNPRSRAPHLEHVYENLVYACSRCNSHKQDRLLAIDPCEDGYGRHLHLEADGALTGITVAGEELIGHLLLNRPELLAYRQQLLRLCAEAERDPNGVVAEYLQSLLAYPADLPDLATLRPPGGNTRPDGVHDSCFARRERGELPATY